MRAILNASPIIAILDEVGEPQIFRLLDGAGWHFMVPSHVAHEEIQKPPGREALLELLEQGIIEEVKDPTLVELEAFLLENPNLDPGESCVILISRAMRAQGVASTVVIDEGPARKRAIELGLDIIGTIGLLLWLENHKLVSGEEAQRFRDVLKSSSFRAGPRLFSGQGDRVT